VPLSKSSLAQALEGIYSRRPASVAQAGSDWAQAYVTYASGATSPTGGLPVTAMAGLSPLTAAFTAALGVLTAAGAAGVMAQGVMAFWQTVAWVAPTYAGVTTVPGNFSLSAALGAVFADLDKKSARDKASSVADAFDAGAKVVMVTDTLLAFPFTPVVGPIS
jgi:hypothetical protein